MKVEPSTRMRWSPGFRGAWATGAGAVDVEEVLVVSEEPMAHICRAPCPIASRATAIRGSGDAATPSVYRYSVDYDWDLSKHQKNLRERGLGFDQASRIFRGDAFAWIDDRFDYGETRMRVLGEVDGELLHVVYTDRGDLRWIISARRASRKERREWHDAH